METPGEIQVSQSKKRRPPWILGGLVFLLLIFLIFLQSSNLWKTLSVETASDTLLLYALSSLNFVALVIFGFIFFRSIVKLIRERRAFQLGSKIKTRLLFYFFAVSLLPILAMAVFSFLFWNRAIERWFAQIPERVVEESQRQAIKDQTIKLQETTRMLADLLENEIPQPEILRSLVRSGNLTRLEILSPAGKILAQSEKDLSAEQHSELEKTLGFIRQNKFDHPQLSDGQGFDAAVARFGDGRLLIVVPDSYAENNINQIARESRGELDKLKSRQFNIRQIGLTTLGLLTFLLIFASSWTAFYIARGLTVPIRALAEGAGEIARGNLAHRVKIFAEDELAILVSAFNQMSARLEANSAELSERRKYIETVLQSLSTGVISFDAENRVTTINKAAKKMLRLEEADFENLKLEDLLNEENRNILEKLINRAKRIGQAGEQTVLQRESTNGSTETNILLPVALTATALPKTPDKQAAGVVLVIEDLSELIAAQRASAWSEVARRMAHEIKNPLTPIQLSAERIAKRFVLHNAGGTKGKNLEGEQISDLSSSKEPRTANREQLTKVINESTETILREVSSLKSMVDEFSRFARLPGPTLEEGNLNEVIRQAVMLYEDRFSDVKIELNLADDLPETMLDEEQIKRVFVNLIDNAIEAFDKTRNNKKIRIKTFHDAARDLIVAEVSDNGNGIRPADFQKLFQPYFSTKGRGTGLGLAIVQRIISEHRGKIKAVNNSPKGAKFIVEIPV